MLKNLPTKAGDTEDMSLIPELGRSPVGKWEMATHCSILAWKISWTEEPGELQSVESPREGNNLVTKQQMCKISQEAARLGF